MKCRKCGAENVSDMTMCGNCESSLAGASAMEPGRTVESDTIESLLSKDARNMESALKERLTKKGGILTRSLVLPMTLVFKSEVETVSLHVDEEGSVSISKGEMSKPRLLVESDQSTICSVLRSRESRISVPGAIRLTVNLGPLRGTKVWVAEGQIMEHPLTAMYGYGSASPLMRKWPPVRRRHLVLVTMLWASFLALTIVMYATGFEGSDMLNVIDFAFALVITVLLTISLLIMLAVNASAQARVEKRP